MTRRALTLAELALLTGRRRDWLELALQFDLRRGLVELDEEGRYRLSEDAERRYGRHLRAIGDEP